MNAARRLIGRSLLAGALAVAFVSAAGCFSPTPSRPTAVAPATSPVPSPGYSASADGSVEATGYVAREEIEGGFWGLFDRPLGPSSAVQPKLLAVLLPGRVTEAEIAAMQGAFVHVAGTLSQGASVRMAGPEVLVDSIAGVASDLPR